MDALLLILGAVIAGVVSYITEVLREARAEGKARRRDRRAVVDVYLPQVLDLLVGLRWARDDIDRQYGGAMHENPYPTPAEGQRVPGSWYGPLLRLKYHADMPNAVRDSADRLLKHIEYWNAVVDDPELATSTAEKLINETVILIGLLERSTQ